MKNKKGFELLGEHTIGVVIAVLCLIVLFYLLSVLFGFFRDQEHLKQAQGYLDEISSNVANLKNVGDYKDLIILSPSEWFISVWPDSDKNYPPSCNKVACICVSRDIPSPGINKDFTWNTASTSLCQTFDNLNLGLKTDYFYRLFCSGEAKKYYQIKPPFSLKMTLKQDKTVYLEENC